MATISGASNPNTVQYAQPQPARTPRPEQAQTQPQAQPAQQAHKPAPTVNTSGQTTGTIVNTRA